MYDGHINVALYEFATSRRRMRVPFRAVGFPFCQKNTVTFIDDELMKWERPQEPKRVPHFYLWQPKEMGPERGENSSSSSLHLVFSGVELNGSVTVAASSLVVLNSEI